jgi:hypothetical protein
MVFVADMVPPELQRIVEFLNEGLSRAQVYAVELPQYVAGEQRSLVPRLVGATAQARQSPGRDRASPGVEALLAAAPGHVRVVDERLRSWATRAGVVLRDTSSGRNLSLGSLSLGMFYPAWGALEIYLGALLEGGLAEEAEALHLDLDRLCASKRLTSRSPHLPTVDLAVHWDEVEPLLDRYAAARVRIERGGEHLPPPSEPRVPGEGGP